MSACSGPFTYVEQTATTPPTNPPVTPPGDYATDTTAPNTRIDSAPKAKVRTKRKKAKVTLAFSSSEPGSQLQCRLDGAPFAVCSSPLTLTVKTGAHVFEVRAVDATGNADASPASAAFKVKRKRPKP